MNWFLRKLISPHSIALLLALVCIGLYARTLGADFVWDARSQILTDTYIHDPHHFADVLSLRVLSEDVLDNNRPTNLLSLMLDALAWGKNPAGYHLMSVLLHAAATVLLFYFCRRMLHDEGSRENSALFASALGALVFAVHPLNCEAVSEVSYREDLLVTVFIFAGMLLACVFVEKGAGKGFALGARSVLCFFLAVGAKESGIAGPFVLALYWWSFHRRDRRWLWIIVPAVAAVLAFMFARFSLQPKSSVVFTGKPSYLGGSLLDAMLIQSRIWVFYFRQIVWPMNFCADYGSYSIRNFGFASSLAILLAVLLAQFFGALRSRAIAVGVALFWLALLPVSNFIPIFRPMADRFLYLSMTGVALALAALLSRLRLTRGTVLIATLAVIGVSTTLGAFTFRREAVWRDSLALWTDTARTNPASYSAANNLGFALLETGRPADAVATFKHATQLAPNEADPLAGLAVAFDELGQTNEADAAFQKAVQLDGRYRHPDLLVKSLTWDEEAANHLRPIAERH